MRLGAEMRIHVLHGGHSQSRPKLPSRGLIDQIRLPCGVTCEVNGFCDPHSFTSGTRMPKYPFLALEYPVWSTKTLSEY